MNYSSTISSKGQVTIPQEVRLRLGLREGDRVEFVVEGGRTLLRPAQPSRNPFKAYASALGNFPGGIQEINAWLSGLREESGDPAKS